LKAPSGGKVINSTLCYNVFPMLRGLIAFLLPCFLAVLAPADAQEQQVSDTQAYLDTVSAAKELPLEKQVETWRAFLADHPNSAFRDEVETNLQSLDQLLLNADPVRKKEAQDTEVYLRAVEFSKKLSERDQLSLWEQFLEEHPTSLYRQEVLTRMEGLRTGQKKGPRTTPRTAPRTVPEVTAPKEAPVVPNLSLKDPTKALLLATFPGLIVPGLGHWYAADYVVAGVLTGGRVVALGFGLPAFIQQRNTLLLAMAILYGATYLIDVADAPFAVDRYNEELEARKRSSKSLSDPNGKGFSLALSMNF